MEGTARAEGGRRKAGELCLQRSPRGEKCLRRSATSPGGRKALEGGTTAWGGNGASTPWTLWRCVPCTLAGQCRATAQTAGSRHVGSDRERQTGPADTATAKGGQGGGGRASFSEATTPRSGCLNLCRGREEEEGREIQGDGHREKSNYIRDWGGMLGERECIGGDRLERHMGCGFRENAYQQKTRPNSRFDVLPVSAFVNCFSQRGRPGYVMSISEWGP